jgi:hypothetical protein
MDADALAESETHCSLILLSAKQKRDLTRQGPSRVLAIFQTLGRQCLNKTSSKTVIGPGTPLNLSMDGVTC